MIASNGGAIRAYEKAGFIVEGRQRQHACRRHLVHTGGLEAQLDQPWGHQHGRFRCGVGRQAFGHDADHPLAMDELILGLCRIEDAARYSGHGKVAQQAAALQLRRHHAAELLVGAREHGGRQDEAVRIALEANYDIRISQADADKRVNEVVTQAKSDIDAARKATAQLAFWLTASLLIGAFCASLAATEGGGLRDGTWKTRNRR